MSYAGMLRDALTGVGDATRRVRRGALLVRAVVAVSGFAALVLVLPAAVLGPLSLLICAALALVPAVLPGTWVVLALELLAMAGWLVRTTAFDSSGSWWALVVLAGAAYLHHTGSALAAVLPLDAVVAGSVLRRWLTRWAAVVAGTALVAALALGVAGRLPVAPTVAIPVLGVLLALFAVGVVAYARAPGPDPEPGE
ncbi:hypothetical protein SAMN05421678_102195 [Actinopolymorpha cephalotaxi]|uniref:Uncharacterized protein n=1 Tax=Actinopolymorpha cephalotaxi TaxID=504797 RepID=A0A1I2LNG2_9ACTN|nr:hypothetical protein [Actinopolymorpha cephalotaxi]NYH81338.1 hypothetical protein [Actinopolymorpha cephalotaxi]SFF79979.1 hypothetical protein SAMN05421678_102195 [Actinopolymorpha cephalotaxi]